MTGFVRRDFEWTNDYINKYICDICITLNWLWKWCRMISMSTQMTIEIKLDYVRTIKHICFEFNEIDDIIYYLIINTWLNFIQTRFCVFVFLNIHLRDDQNIKRVIKRQQKFTNMAPWQLYAQFIQFKYQYRHGI